MFRGYRTPFVYFHDLNIITGRKEMQVGNERNEGGDIAPLKGRYIP